MSSVPEYYSSIEEIQRLRATLDVLNAGVSHVSPEGKILWVNRFYCDFYGYTLEELQGLSVEDTTHPADLSQQLECLKQVASNQVEAAQMDRRCRRKDGTYAWANVSTRILRSSQGKPLFFVSILQDIRDRKAAELELRESQGRLEQALNLAKLGSWYVDRATRETHWSAECYKVFGRDPKDGPYSHEEFLQLIHPEDLEHFKNGIKTRIGSSVDFSMVYRIIRKSDGEIRTIRSVARHIADPDGGPGRSVGSIHDITDWVEQQAAKKQSEELLRLVLNTVPARIGYVTRDLRYRFVNRGYELQLNKSRDQIVGKSVREIQGEKVFKDFQEYYNQVLSGKVVEVEKAVVGLDGKTRQLFVVFSPDFGPNREVLGFVTLIQDVTEEREKERMILEQRQRMISSAKLAALGEMAGGISHEINNPLAVIHARAETLKLLANRGSLDLEKVAYCAEKIELTSKRIAKIVKALRNIARDGEKDPFSKALVRTVIEDAVEICRERFQHYVIDFEVGEIGDDLTVECRAVQISQVVLNLLSNAFDAAKGREKRWVKLGAVRIGEQIEISVTDNGPGVPTSLRDKVFHPFFTTKDPGEGTGLGLSVSKAIVDDHHGAIYIDESSPNTRFVVRLPIKQSESPAHSKC